MKKSLVILTLLLVLVGCSATAETKINVSDFSIDSNGNLVYQNEVIGKVVGQNGVAGIDGQDGYDGINGKNGINGVDGVDGTNGSNGSNGKDGYTPYIGTNGNWWINGQDTGYLAGTQKYSVNDTISTLTPSGSIVKAYEYTNGWNYRTLVDVEVIQFEVWVDIIVDKDKLLTNSEYLDSLLNQGYPYDSMFIELYKYRIFYNMKIKVPDEYKDENITYKLSSSASWVGSDLQTDADGIFETSTILYVNDLTDIGVYMYIGTQH